MRQFVLLMSGLAFITTACGGGGGSSSSTPGTGGGNIAPTANAGADQTAVEGDIVNLDGSQSSDPDGSISTYSWRQTVGPNVALTNVNTATPSFQAPEAVSSEQLQFELTVTDNGNRQSRATIDVAVNGSATRILTGEGFIEGFDAGSGIEGFRGIPFAHPPVGELRWKAPEPAESRADLLDSL